MTTERFNKIADWIKLIALMFIPAAFCFVCWSMSKTEKLKREILARPSEFDHGNESTNN